MANTNISTDNLFNMLNSIESKVESQVNKSTEEVKSYTKRLTWHDKLITDDLLLNLEPDILKASMANDEYEEFIKKYPDYEINYNNWLTSKKPIDNVETNDNIIKPDEISISEKINEDVTEEINENEETKIMTAVVDNEVSQPAFKSRPEKKPKQNWLSKFKKKFMNISSSDEQLEFDDTEYTEDYENNFVDPDKPSVWKPILNISVIIIVIIITYFLIN